MGTAAGINTRRYHGLFVASTHPPVGRVIALNQVLEQLILTKDRQEHVIDWTTCSFKNSRGEEVFAPKGYLWLSHFDRGLSVRWTYTNRDSDTANEVAHFQFVRELRLDWKQQAAEIHYSLKSLGDEANNLVGSVLRLNPLLTLRDFHSVLKMPEAANAMVVESKGKDVITVGHGETSVTIQCPGSVFIPKGKKDDPWWYGIHYRCETQRGQEDEEDYFAPGWFEVKLDDKGMANVMLSVALGEKPGGDDTVGDQTQRVQHLAPVLKHVSEYSWEGNEDRLIRTLVVASDDFIVDRRFRGTTLKTIMAGYPWFADWGRDTFIAMPGLLLATGRFDEAKSALKTFAGVIKNGLVPNRFDDYSDSALHYNSVDASLWFVHAAIEYRRVSGDVESWDSWLSVATTQVLEGFVKGTDYDIRMAGDGLITAGTPQTQLTWMDAACDGVVFTPRHGKAVEINALWYSNLVGVAELVADQHKSVADHYTRLAKRVKRSFAKVFWDDELGYLRDHVWIDDAEQEHINHQLRPNQIFAASLERSPLPMTKQKLVVKAVGDYLVTPFGLRTLDANDPDYQGCYSGPAFDRDRAYHQGTVWPWLIGPYAEGLLRIGRFSSTSKLQARTAIQPLLDFLMGDGLGQLNEIHEGHAPHRPVGCMAQAWSVAETLRVLSLLSH